MTAVRVKPLEWREVSDGRYSSGVRPNEFTADRYTISLAKGGAWRIDDGRFSFLRQSFPTLGTAVDAAQVDYEKRILSALIFE